MAVSEQERNDFIRKCIAEGMTLSKVQDALGSELGIRMTYMELRMLTSELAISWEAQDRKTEAARPHSKPEPTAAAAEAAAGEEAVPGEDEAPAEEAIPGGDEAPAAETQQPGGGATKVEISKLVRPGTAISGNVTFASGAHGEWYVDQMGRLGLALAEGSAKPTPSDIQKFQVELQKQLQGGAY